MILSNALSRLHIETQEDVHDVIPPNFLYYLKAAHINHNYKNLVYTIFKHKAKLETQMSTKTLRV